MNYEIASRMLQTQKSILVRLHTVDRAAHRNCGHMIGATPTRAIVKPFRHQKTERIPWEQISLWKAGNAKWNERNSLAKTVEHHSI